MSCAEPDAVDPGFERFVADLSEELRGAMGAQTARGLVFVASEIPLGADRPSYTEHALMTCPVFLALLSPTYIRDAGCTKEWSRFDARRAASDGATARLLPLIWIPIPDRELPPEVQSRQVANASLGATYARHGLRQVVQRAGLEYREFLRALAEHVRDLASSSVVAASPGPAVPDAVVAAAAAPQVARQDGRPARHAGRRNVVLFLAANPDGSTPLALDDECRAIELELQSSTAREDFVFYSKWAVSIDEMMRHLNGLKPTIVHFSGHGAGDAVADGAATSQQRRDVVGDVGVDAGGILLQDERRRPQHVRARALAKMIGSAAPSARVVLLNACYSESVAEALRGVVDCVVGMRGAIGDPAARCFAVAFYRALGHRCSVGNAVSQAVAILDAYQLPEEKLPVCVTRDGVVADLLLLHEREPVSL